MFFAWASFMKFMAPDDFARVVYAVLGEAPSMRIAVLLGVGLAGAELALALLLVLDRQSDLWKKAGVLLLVLFCGVLIRLLLMTDPPSCGCLSVRIGRGTSVEQITGLGRNLALGWLLVLSMRSSDTTPADATDPVPEAVQGAG